MKFVLKRRYLALVAVFLLALSASVFWLSQAIGSPKAELWERWAAHDPASTQSVDQSDFNEFLFHYVKTSRKAPGHVAYAEVSAEHRSLLARHLERQKAVPVSRLSRNEQLAYWINLYNALTVKLILDHYPVDSILEIKISPGLLGFGPWDAKIFEVEGESISLNDIEHRILRPIWRDPRVHYAINCASIGCPDLANVAYDAAHIDQMLNVAAIRFIGSDRGADLSDGRLVLSSIYDWFAEDFGGSEAAVLQHLTEYALTPKKQELKKAAGIDGYAYDWALNDGAAPENSRRSGGSFSR